jgi:hypothetical protein
LQNEFSIDQQFVFIIINIKKNMKASAILLLTAAFAMLCVSGKAPDQDNNLIS